MASRNIKYINRDFDDFKAQLIEYSKTYFPDTHSDFSSSSLGAMFIEQAAYVGDVLSFYLDNQIQEGFIQHVQQTNNSFDLAYMFGYKPKVTSLSNVEVEIVQIVPSKLVGDQYVPDYDYALFIPEFTQITGDDGEFFTLSESVDFSINTSTNPTNVTVAQIVSNEPSLYFLKKTVKAQSGEIKTTEFSFGSHEEFPTVSINEVNIAGILDIVDSDGNIWYEVENLGQDVIFESVKNTNENDPNNYQYSNQVPYILKSKRVQRRFITRFLNESVLNIQFGSGNADEVDEEILPDLSNVGLGLPYGKSKMTTSYSPLNFIFTNTYGIAPTNTTLTVRYIVGGGVKSNVRSNSLNVIDNAGVKFLKYGLNPATAQFSFDSLSINNPQAATGGRDGDTIEELRQNTMAQFQSQMRNVTADDYLIRSLSMPEKFGAISKAIAKKPLANQSNSTIDLYILGQDSNGKLSEATPALKENLKKYISQYKMIGDSITIKDAFIINIGVDFEIVINPDYNANEVIRNCILEVQDYFDLSLWNINQPIFLKKLELILDSVSGVQHVKSLKIINKKGSSDGYSNWAYDIEGANRNNIIYPSLDPMIFELKYPLNDIKGKIVTQ